MFLFQFKKETHEIPFLYVSLLGHLKIKAMWFSFLLKFQYPNSYFK